MAFTRHLSSIMPSFGVPVQNPALVRENVPVVGSGIYEIPGDGSSLTIPVTSGYLRFKLTSANADEWWVVGYTADANASFTNLNPSNNTQLAYLLMENGSITTCEYTLPFLTDLPIVRFRFFFGTLGGFQGATVDMEVAATSGTPQ